MAGETDAAHAANARAFNNWLVNDWLAAYPYSNVAVFDFYNVLTSNGGDFFTHDAGQETGNHHRIWNGTVQHIRTVDSDMSAYPDGDSHPTPAGNQKATAEFVPLLNYYYNRWKSVEAPAVAPTATPEQVEPTSAPEADIAQPDETQPVTAGIIESFDAAPEYWEASSDGEGSLVDFWIDNESAYSGTGAGCIEYSIVPDGWGYYGRSFEPIQDWGGGNGLVMWLHSPEAGQWATLMLFAGDPQAATPFETHFEIKAESSEDWSQYVFAWTTFERAAWADVGGLSELDPTQVVGLGFSFGAEGEPVEGTLWVDELSLGTGDIESPSPAADASPPEPATAPSEAPAGATEPAQATEAAAAVEPTTPAEPTAAPAEPVESPVEEETSGGLCPLSMIMLPLGWVAVVLVRRGRSA